jgi:hypothetical protein
VSTYIPVASSLISFVFASMVLKKWAGRKQPFLLLWGSGFVMYGIASGMEAVYGFVGWHALVFRLWYLFGAVLVAAWLGQGTVYLLVHRTIGNVRLAHILMVLLAAGSLFALVKVAGAQLDPTLLPGSEMDGVALLSPVMHILTVVFNIYGTLMLVGGAIYSAYYFWRTRSAANRMIGNILIAAGALTVASAGAAQRLGIPSVLYLGEFAGVVVMFIGYLYTSRPARTVEQVTATVEGTQSS